MYTHMYSASGRITNRSQNSALRTSQIKPNYVLKNLVAWACCFFSSSLAHRLHLSETKRVMFSILGMLKDRWQILDLERPKFTPR